MPITSPYNNHINLYNRITLYQTHHPISITSPYINHITV